MQRVKAIATVACAAAILFTAPVTSLADAPSDPEPPPALAGQDSLTIETNRVAGLLSEIAERFSSTAGTTTIDYETQTILQRYNPQDGNASTYVKAVQSVDSGSITVDIQGTDYTREDLKNAVLQLATDSEMALDVFGAIPQDIGFTDAGLEIVLPPGTSPAPSLQADEVLGLPASVRVATSEPLPEKEGWQSSGADNSPWSAGASINAALGSVGCTSGFVWDKWTTRERFGSTAEHCYPYVPTPTSPTQVWRTPPGSLVGNRYHYDVAADTQLIRAASGTSFAPTAWVGYTDKRTVKGYDLNVPATQVVALYGRTSGYHSTTVKGHFARTMSDGSTTLLARTNSTVCDYGDSGGPWFYASSDGQLVAVGQHVGDWGLGCEFVQIGTISAELSASVLLG
ncbi:S1 family peptidase [Tessaracoccus sp. OS52]|uniref:S1 family peptidase n=1 Tax=Tessaracoccus sp. OS52 TaxID=2886691 RepID=UPI001D1043AF|nr:S1 family peptidase [Tessaracoccus sp. OS52]MCC2593145.1 S1 family peptidase [Tessaracoccus sp. OS52]